MDQVRTEKIDTNTLLPYYKKYVAMIRGSHHQPSTNADGCFIICTNEKSITCTVRYVSEMTCKSKCFYFFSCNWYIIDNDGQLHAEWIS